MARGRVWAIQMLPNLIGQNQIKAADLSALLISIGSLTNVSSWIAENIVALERKLLTPIARHLSDLKVLRPQRFNNAPIGGVHDNAVKTDHAQVMAVRLAAVHHDSGPGQGCAAPGLPGLSLRWARLVDTLAKGRSGRTAP